jgi:hypothetical protein
MSSKIQLQVILINSLDVPRRQQEGGVVTSVQGATLFVSKVTCAQQQLELFDRALVCAQVSSYCVTFGLVFGFFGIGQLQ